MAKIKITKKYLAFPINTRTSEKVLQFKNKNKVVYELNIKLDNVCPDFNAYIDVSRFIGEELELTVDPYMDFTFEEKAEMDIKGLYKERFRPQIHFTVKNGWLNDPNGLVFLNNYYHMFYQYNPTEPYWDNMHWGHAVSNDLIHWEEKDVALFPDERGKMYSGSCVVDNKNTFGHNNDNECALLFYTTTEPFCQNLSYSLDNFKTIENYENNPILSHITGDNRDPKVIYCDELNAYLMALYLEEDVYGLYVSRDFINWDELQRIRINGDNECPDIFYIYNDNNEKKLILMGAHDRYIVGSVKNGLFVQEQSEKTLHYGSSGYAGQSYSNMPNNRIVRVQWDKWKVSLADFAGQMSIPFELSLKNIKGEEYLCAEPVNELNNLIIEKFEFRNLTVNSNCFNKEIDFGPYVIEINSDYLNNNRITFTIFGRSIIFDFTQNKIILKNLTAPISLFKNVFNVKIIVDTCSFEIFADDGKICLSALNERTIMDENVPYISLKSLMPCEINSFKILKLKSIWE